jgi:methyl-accepting chemotaxis protein
MNMDNAGQAAILAEKNAEYSLQGAGDMAGVLENMELINQSTSEIQAIIDVIDDIAFQTNMLALNAAVEAARAGESGMGFAVVADEVKNLANRSAESAKETAKMIKDVISRISMGFDMSKKLAEVFRQIQKNSVKVKDMIKEVEAASRQQNEGISQINKAISELDSVVQKNASVSEETASAAEELFSQVKYVNEMIEDLILTVTGSETDKSAAEELPVTQKQTGLLRRIE